MLSGQTRELQRALNRFTTHYLRYVQPVRVDGDKGHATNQRIRLCKYYLGYVKSRRNAAVGAELLYRLRHPYSTRYGGHAALGRAYRRRAQQRKLARPTRRERKMYGIGTYDGVPCANVAMAILDWCRQDGWRGRLVSGWRSKPYSQHLCYAMCGRPTCPGRCAGIYTNHVGDTPNKFAIDVTDYYTFARVVARCPLSPRIFNSLPADRVHFSPTGR